MKKRLLIAGAGSHARRVYNAALASGMEVLCFFDENTANSAPVYGIEVRHSVEGLNQELFIAAVGDGAVRKRLYGKFTGLGWQAATVIHPGSHVCAEARIGAGSVLLAGSVVELDAHIGVSCIIDIGALVGHDSTVGDFCHLKPGSIVEPYSSVADFSVTGPGEVVRKTELP